MAICCDVFVKEKPNKYKGTRNNKGVVDDRETITQVCIAFMTEETIHIEGKGDRPRYASFWASAKWGTIDYPSNLRQFVKGWFPSMTDAQVEDLDTENLLHQPAYLTITHSASKDGKVWANVTSAATPPKGAAVPEIPADFLRHDVKHGNTPAQQEQPAPIGSEDEDDGMPF